MFRLKSLQELVFVCLSLQLSAYISSLIDRFWRKFPFFRKSAFERNYESEVSNDFFTDLHFACIRQSMQGLRQLLASLAIFLLLITKWQIRDNAIDPFNDKLKFRYDK